MLKIFTHLSTVLKIHCLCDKYIIENQTYAKLIELFTFPSPSQFVYMFQFWNHASHRHERLPYGHELYKTVTGRW